MFALFPEDLSKKVARPVDDLRALVESGNGVDIATQEKELLYAVKGTESSFNGGEDIKGANLRSGVAGFDGLGFPDLTGVGHFSVADTNDTGKVEHVPAQAVGQVIAARRRRLRKDKSLRRKYSFHGVHT